MDEELIVKERTLLGAYLAERKSSLENLTLEMGENNVSKLVLHLGNMEKLFLRAKEAAKTKDFESAAYIIGAGAKVVKDRYYMVLTEVYGLPILVKENLQGNPALLRDYIMERYDLGYKNCEQLLEK